MFAFLRRLFRRKPRVRPADRFRPVTYVTVAHGTVATTVPVMDGRAYADYDRAGRLLGVEFTCRVEVIRSSDLVEVIS